MITWFMPMWGFWPDTLCGLGVGLVAYVLARWSKVRPVGATLWALFCTSCWPEVAVLGGILAGGAVIVGIPCMIVAGAELLDDRLDDRRKARQRAKEQASPVDDGDLQAELPQARALRSRRERR